MLDLTYEVLARDKERIRQKVSELLDETLLSDSISRWNDCALKSRASVIAGEDGSINSNRYKNLVIYAVNASALVYGDKITVKAHADVGVLHPYFQIEERLHLYRAIYEFKTALEVIDSVELFLIDGSLLSDLLALRRLERGLSKESREEVLALLPMLEKAKGVRIASNDLCHMLGKNDYNEKVGFLEYLEYLSCIEKLLSKGIDKIAGISKLSTRSRLGKGVPDLAVYGETTFRSGYSNPEAEVVTKKFPAYNEFFRSLVFTISSIRLEDGKDVYLLEVPREIDDDELVDILEKIKSISVDGYPYLLKKAHKEVTITNREMKRLTVGLGIVAKTGREVLK